MLRSWYGKYFYITGSLWWETVGHQGILFTKASKDGQWCILINHLAWLCHAMETFSTLLLALAPHKKLLMQSHDVFSVVNLSRQSSGWGYEIAWQSCCFTVICVWETLCCRWMLMNICWILSYDTYGKAVLACNSQIKSPFGGYKCWSFHWGCAHSKIR